MKGKLHHDPGPNDIADRKRAEDALKWSARRDELLSQTATRLLQSHDPQGVVEELCRAVMAFLECDVFFNFLMDERAGRLRLNACGGIPEDESRKIEWLDLGVSVCGSVARDRERIIAEDIRHTPDSRPALARSYGVQAYCCHPLMAQDRLIGTLSFGTRSRPRFRPEEVEVMKTVTNLVAIAMQRIQTETALRETHDYLQKLIDYANAPIIVWNPSFQITRFNHAFERLTGRRAADVIGQELQILFPEATREESMTHIRRTATGERWETLEIPIAHLDGRVYTVLWNSATLFDADGRTPIATIAQGQDITDRKRLEEDLRAIAANLADANRLKDEFLGTLSHELRTPLNAILGWSQMLLHRRLDPVQIRHALEVIDRNTKAQVKLVEDVLDVSRILSGKLRLAMHRVNLNESVKAALDAIRPAADAKGVEIATAVAPDVVLVGDPDRLQQICWNLLSNAVKFTPKGGRVEVRVHRVDSRIELRVQDTGAGIAPEFLPHLFERFRQADSSTTRQHGGLGLGLAIVRHLVELHGGAVAAESAGPGRGAVFTVTLPVSAVAAPKGEPGTATIPGPPSPAAGIAQSLTGLRVLVVDDEADARDLLRHVLRECGAEVKLADSVQAGLEAVQQWRPDVVLGDIGMPREDGYELVRRIRALPPERGGLTPAAALTAYGGTEDRLRALAAGYQRHVAKPVAPDELAALVSALAERPREY